MGWALTSCFGVPHHFHYDSTLVGGFAFNVSRWNFYEQHTKLADSLTMRRRLLEIRMVFGSAHVKAHNYHPWNSLVDQLAVGSRLGIVPGSELGVALPLLTRHPFGVLAWQSIVHSPSMPQLGELESLSPGHRQFGLCRSCRKRCILT